MLIWYSPTLYGAADRFCLVSSATVQSRVPSTGPSTGSQPAPTTKMVIAVVLLSSISKYYRVAGTRATIFQKQIQPQLGVQAPEGATPERIDRFLQDSVRSELIDHPGGQLVVTAEFNNIFKYIGLCTPYIIYLIIYLSIY
jgi:hypothetical protein